MRQCLADAMGILRAGVKHKDVVGRAVIADRAPRLHGARHNAVVDELELHPMR
jgi:hypothetical protein